MLRTFLRRYGILPVTIGLTIVSIFLSVVISYGINQLMGGGPLRGGLLIAIVVPAIISPILGGHTMYLLSQLDQTEQRFQLLSNTDELTQTYNRRYFIQLGEQELKRANRYAEAFSIAIIDLDNFKAINDQHGHLVGDQTLFELSRLCAGSIREVDVFARYGGDEFIFLFPFTNKMQARELARRVFEKISSTPLYLQDLEMRLVLSMGVATFSSRITSLDDLLAEADRALYRAKKAGGNRFMFSFDE